MRINMQQKNVWLDEPVQDTPAGYTPAGYTIPVPTREDVLRDLQKVAQPNRRSTRRSGAEK